MNTIKKIHMLFKIFFTSILFCVFNSSFVIAKEFNIENGEILYQKNCSSCHMKNLNGHPKWQTELDEDGHRQAPPLNGTGHTWHHAPKDLFQTIRYGYKKIDPNYKGKMIGNKNLTDDEVWSILNYIKNIWPENIKMKYESHFGD